MASPLVSRCLFSATFLATLPLMGACVDSSLFSSTDSESEVVEDHTEWPELPQSRLATGVTSNPLERDPPVISSPEAVIEIGAGNIHVCARLTSGSILCWGHNSAGQLGNGTRLSSSLPAPVVGLTDSSSLQVGEESTCSLDADGTAKCWGWNHDGPGDSYILEPTLIQDLTGIHEIIPARTAVCAVMLAGEINCWGDNVFGQLGDGTNVDHYAPTPVVGISDAIDAAGAEGHFCAVHESGEVSCWGWNGSGQLGYDGPDSTTPIKVAGISNAIGIGVGHSHSCAILDTGELTCWGANDSGQLGDGTYQYRSTPLVVPGLANVKQVVGGYVHTCALLESGEVYCFGWDANGNVGDGGSSEENVWDVLSPSKVLGIDDAVQLACGALADFNCVLRASGEVSCWGLGYSGQLGPDVIDYPYGVAYSPVTITGLPIPGK